MRQLQGMKPLIPTVYQFTFGIATLKDSLHQDVPTCRSFVARRTETGVSLEQSQWRRQIFGPSLGTRKLRSRI